jgi:glucose-6-phosphate isomerase
MVDDAREAAWAALMALAARPDAAAIRPLFVADPDRFARFSRQAGDVLLDFSKTAISDAVLDALFALAEASDVAGFRARLFQGAAVNSTEGRAALHMALRAAPEDQFSAGTENIMPEMLSVRARMEAFTRAVHEGRILTATGQRFTDVLNIGIGGSDLGPAMVARALWTDKAPLRGHYLANVDGHAWAEMQAKLDPTRTLVLVASKTFTTQETMANAALARDWLREAVGEAGAAQHMAALSTNLAATSAFGIAPERVFGFRDWVGGRFSLWSAIGLSLALTLGWDAFARLLAGARVMDQHFRNAPLSENLPVLLALVEVWHVNGLGYPSRAVLPYDERLARLPAHLQQLEMESLGKRVALSGTSLQRASGPVVYGEPDTDAQHSFMQLLHQGTTPVPVESILVARPDHAHADSLRKLLADGFAQAEALQMRKGETAVIAEMHSARVAEAEITRLLPDRIFPDDRTSVPMSLHFRNAPLSKNQPVLLELVETRHVNGLGYTSRTLLLFYDERLARLQVHLQPLEMESLGKRVAVSGAALNRASGPVVFGEPGTNAQHSFMQLLHQGTTPVPVDFILVARPDHAHADSHRKLLANGLAQAEALLNGKDAAAVTAEMRVAGVAEAEIARLLPHRVFPGDRPSVTMLLPQLDAYTLGQLVALYEHKVAVLGALWGINPFDQWGVELGKQLAGAILAELNAGAPRKGAHNGSTAGLISRIAALWPEGHT